MSTSHRIKRKIHPGGGWPTINRVGVRNPEETPINLPNSRLLTPKIIRFIAIGFKFGEFFRAHPHRWRKEGNRPETEIGTSQTSIVFWWLNVLNTFCTHIFCAVVVALRPRDLNPNVKIYLNFLLIADTIIPCNHLAVILTKEVLPVLVTSIMDYVIFFERNYMQRDAGTLKSVKIIENFLGLIYYGLLIGAASVVLIPLFVPHIGNSAVHLVLHINPDDKHFYISSEWMHYLCLMFRAQWVVSAFIMSYNFLATCFLLIFTGFPMIFAVLTMISHMNLKNLEDLENSFGNRNNAIQVYRQIKILVMEVFSAFGFAIAYNKVVILFTAIYSLYGAVTSSGAIALFLGFVGINGVIYLAVLFTALGKIHLITEMRLAEWKSSDIFREQLFRRKLGTLTSMKIYVLVFYFVDRSMVLTMLEFIINSVVNLLVGM